jgi:hypothetical protein
VRVADHGEAVYQRALKLDPKNTNAADALRKLKDQP